MSPNPVSSSSSSSCSLREVDVDSVGQVIPPIRVHKEGVKVKVDSQLSNKRKDRDQARGAKAIGKRRSVPCRTSNRLRIKQEREEHTRNASKPESDQLHLENQNLFIRYGHNKNPYHKILFLHRLGLSPISGAPFRRFERINFLPESLTVLENRSKVSSSLLDRDRNRAVGEKEHSLKIGNPNRAKILNPGPAVRSRNDNHRRRQQEVNLSPVTCQSVPEPNSNLPGVADVIKIERMVPREPRLLHQNNVKLLARVPHSRSTPVPVSPSPPLKIPDDTDVIVIEVGNEPNHLRNSMHKLLQQHQYQQFAQNKKSDSDSSNVIVPCPQVTSTSSNKLFPIFQFGQKQQRSDLSNDRYRCGANLSSNAAKNNNTRQPSSSLSFKTVAHQMKYRNSEMNNATNKPPQKLRPRILRRQFLLQTSGNVHSRSREGTVTVSVPVPVPVRAQNLVGTPVPVPVPVPVVVPASSLRVLQPASEIQIIDLASDEDEDDGDEELIRIRKRLATWHTEVQVISE